MATLGSMQDPTETVSPAMQAPSLNPWTREVLGTTLVKEFSNLPRDD